MIANIIRQIYLDYLIYLSEGGARIRIPHHTHVEPENPLVYSSNLLMCPLKVALKAAKAPHIIQQTPEDRLSSLHVMEQGTRDAEPIQEAMLWHAREHREPQMEVLVEYSMQHKDLPLRGRIDLVITLNGHTHLIEMKRRPGYAQQPLMSHIFQVLSYKSMWPINTSIHVMTIGRTSRDNPLPAFSLWSGQMDVPLRDADPVFFAEDGSPWEHLLNRADYINFETMEKEVAHQYSYLTKENTGIPIADFLNTDTHWYCVNWVGDKAKKYKSVYKGQTERMEAMRPSCEYFCHFPIEELDEEGQFLVREVEYQSGVYAPVNVLPSLF